MNWFLEHWFLALITATVNVVVVMAIVSEAREQGPWDAIGGALGGMAGGRGFGGRLFGALEGFNGAVGALRMETLKRAALATLAIWGTTYLLSLAL